MRYADPPHTIGKFWLFSFKPVQRACTAGFLAQNKTIIHFVCCLLLYQQIWHTSGGGHLGSELPLHSLRSTSNKILTHSAANRGRIEEGHSIQDLKDYLKKLQPKYSVFNNTLKNSDSGNANVHI